MQQKWGLYTRHAPDERPSRYGISSKWFSGTSHQTSSKSPSSPGNTAQRMTSNWKWL